ncbi:hypothetical protein [Paracoccus xiamenensis]|uniref:hypothetical protein n=1 Tax=Paracoccus xiamenensis TaxID=2714901 RepID=UPI00140926B8|nr:hypothetical protein [Paracoccus xiamenensis]NHF71579.1 hypothetical protein [Paracoccus xiamenensis]
MAGNPNDPDENEVVLEISAEDLASADLIGPKIAAFARLREDIAAADFDGGAVSLRYHSGGEMALDVSELLGFLRQAPDGQAVMDILDDALTEPSEDEGYLLPVLKGADYIETVQAQLREAGAPADQPLPFWYQPLRTGLNVVLMHDTPQMMRSVSEAELAGAGLDLDMARQQAMQDLARFCHERDLQVGSIDDKLFQLQLDGNYEASTYFLSGLWDDIQDEFGAPPAALFAARNVVIYANSADAEAMRLLQIVAAPGDEVPAHAIAPHQILYWTDDGWSLLPAQDAPGLPH